MIIASAGHVEHGKTTLLQALSGARSPDRKARGTVDLDFAWWPQPDGRIVSFIDVPGDRRYLGNMLSGVSGLDHVLLAVAADEGVMPQTREHLAILRLSGQPPLTIVITKSDLAESGHIKETERQLRELTALMGWPEATLFVTSALNATGISALADHISQLPPRAIADGRRFRLAIDRAFSLPGTGTVVTGTALGGQVRVGDRLWLTGINKSVRVQGLLAQNQPADIGYGGQRLALNLIGGVEKNDLARGDWLLEEPPAMQAGRPIISLQKCRPLPQQPLHIHHAASHVTGRVTMLTENLAELALDKPLWLADNDRLLLRDEKHTLAGAQVVLLAPPKRGQLPDYLRWLQQLATAESDREALRLCLQMRPWRKNDLDWARQLTDAAFSRTLKAIAPIDAGDYLLLPEISQPWQQLLLATLEKYQQEHGDQPGLGRQRLSRMALPGKPEAIGLALIDRLLANGTMQEHYGWLRLPAFLPTFTPNEQALWQRAEPLLTEKVGWARDLAARLHADEELTRATLRKAASSGEIVAIVHDRYYSRRNMIAFADIIRQRHQRKLATSAADFRDLLGSGRKLAVQILEFFDRCGFTRRQGNSRQLRDDTLFRQ